jgi:Holliday junction resolvase RusA-like endonuclease
VSDGVYRVQLPWLALCPDNQRLGKGSGGQRSFLTNKYRDAKAWSVLLMRKATPPAADLPCRVVVRFWVPNRARRDCANLWKLISDAMQEAGVIEDDTLFWDIRLIREGMDRANPRAEIEVTPM